MNVPVFVAETRHKYRPFLSFLLSLYSMDISSIMPGVFVVYENAFSEIYLLDRLYSVKYQFFAEYSMTLSLQEGSLGFG